MSNVPVTIASIVEGDGERFALPKLLHRIAADHGVYNLHAAEPWRTPRSKLIAARGVEKAVDAVATRVRGRGGILVLLDADDDCPAQCGPGLLARTCGARQDMRIRVVLANREYEAWFLAGAASLAGKHEFPSDLRPPDNAERIRGCKEWLTRQRARGHPYKETVDQAPLSSSLDLRLARENSPSFDKFYRDVALLPAEN